VAERPAPPWRHRSATTPSAKAERPRVGVAIRASAQNHTSLAETRESRSVKRSTRRAAPMRIAGRASAKLHSACLAGVPHGLFRMGLLHHPPPRLSAPITEVSALAALPEDVASAEAEPPTAVARDWDRVGGWVGEAAVPASFVSLCQGSNGRQRSRLPARPSTSASALPKFQPPPNFRREAAAMRSRRCARISVLR
jgi:hypothetical protein